MHPSRVLILFSLSFLAGVLAASLILFPAKVIFSVFILGVVSIIFSWKSMPVLEGRKIYLILIGFFLIIFSLGVWRYQSNYNKARSLFMVADSITNLIDEKSRHPIKMEFGGYVSEPSYEKGGKQYVTLKVKRLYAEGRILAIDEKTLVETDLYPTFNFGQEIKILGTPLVPSSDGQLNYKAYLAKDGIYTYFIYPQIKVEKQELTGFWDKLKVGFFGPIYKIRLAFENAIKKSIAEPNASFVGGTILGGKVFRNDSLSDYFKKTGTSHILAVSGYNVTIIAEVVLMLLLAFIGRRKAMILSIIIIAIFAVLVGAEASVMRAAIMGILVLLAKRSGRLASPGPSIIGAAAVMVLFNPMILIYDVGFQLSFLATIGILYLSPVFKKIFAGINNALLKKICDIGAETLAAQCLVILLLVYYFERLSIYSLPVNIVVLPLIPLIMLSGFLTGLFGMFVPVLGKIIGMVSWLISSIAIYVIKLASKIPGSCLSISISLPLIIVIYLIILGLLIYYWRRKSLSTLSE